MLYRIRIDLAFVDYDPLNDMLEEAIRRLPTAVTINPGALYQERGYITVEECYHDEDPNQPCVILEHHETP